MIDRLQLVRDCYGAYETGDREALERVVGADFVFSAPPDVGIDRATYFQRCWPNHERLRAFAFTRLFEHDGEVVATYVATRADGTRFTNTEVFGFQGDRLGSVEVYFGWDLPPRG